MGIVARQATFNTLLAYLGIALGFVNVVLLRPTTPMWMPP